MTKVRRAGALFAALALTFGIAATPALALSLGVGGTACVDGAGDSAARIAVGAKGGELREKVTGQLAKALPARAQGKAPAGFAAVVPVYFHVITDGATGNVSGAAIRTQIRVLNTTFGGGEGGDNTGFSFDLAGITRTNNAEWYAIATFDAEVAMKQALKQGGNNALNVYSTSGDLYLGWAYYPDIVTTNQAYLDGIVIDWRSMKGVSTAYAGAYDQGETLTHEAGHWLNLAHTFEGKCSPANDFVADTPAQKTPTGGCPVGKDTCHAPGLDPIHNYMDYSYDTCYTEFTPGQTQRARDAWLLYRAP
ncbi:MAG: zinc metalloprotease [Candidatus Limnocylindrales bacterium]